MSHQSFLRNFSRRTMLQASAALSGVAAISGLGLNFAHAAGKDRIKVGLVGCGGRGTQAAGNCIEADPGVQIHAMADLFPDRLESSRDGLISGHGGKKGKKQEKGKAEPPGKDRVDVPDDRCFTGFDAYQKLMATDVDMVILATPPAFRSIHLDAAIKAGKNVFMEKPVAVDPVGIRSVIASGELAKSKGLAIVAGTQRRHQHSYRETIQRIHDGAIGEVLGGSCYWNGQALWSKPRQPNWSDLEYQLRNWLYYTWLSGDHIVEQHVHNLDVMNWVMRNHPIKAVGMGGRQTRTEAIFGNIFDHHSIEFTYPDGQRVISMCRQQINTSGYVGEFVRGSKGDANPNGKINPNGFIFKAGADNRSPYVIEHADLIASIRSGKPLNEARQVAESTMTAILGRMATYSGQDVKWDDAIASNLSLVPEKLEMGPMPFPKVAVPGVDKPF